MKKTAFSRLESALKTLHHHIDLSQKENVFLLNKKISHTIQPFAKLISTYFVIQINKRKREEIFSCQKLEEKKLTSAIHLIQKHHRLIAQWKLGNEKEKNLASLTEETIAKYNELLIHTQKKPKKIGERLSRYFHKKIDSSRKFEIILPAKATLTSTNANKADCLANNLLPCTPKVEEADFFKMKVIQKMQTDHLLSIQDILQTIRKSPIIVTKNPKTSTVTLKQSMLPFPGEKIDFSASYERGQKTASLPSGDITYQLDSHQTGFPDPALLFGFTFSEAFIPSYLRDPREDLELAALLKEKREVAHALLPNGSLNLRGKSLYQMMRSLYQISQDTFISSHTTFLKKLFPTKNLLIETAPDLNTFVTPYRLVNQSIEKIAEQIELSTLVENFSIDLCQKWIHKEEVFLKNNPFAASLFSSLFESGASELLLHLYVEPKELSEKSSCLYSITLYQERFFLNMLKGKTAVTEEVMTTYFNGLVDHLK